MTAVSGLTRPELESLLERERASLEWITRHLLDAAVAAGVPNATGPQLVEAVKALVTARDRWAHQCNLASEAQADALNVSARLTRKPDDEGLRVNACQTDLRTEESRKAFDAIVYAAAKRLDAEDPFACHSCGLSFFTAAKLNEHVANNHAEFDR